MDNQKKEKKPLWLILALLFLVALLVMIFMYADSRKSIQKVIEQRVRESTSHQRELDSLTFEFESIKKAYGSLNQQLKGKDSLIQENIQRINQLIASNVSKDRIIRELEQLRSQKLDYERRLDSLLYINMELTDKNLELKYRVEAEKEKNIVLTEEKEEFKRKAILGEKIRAYNISAGGYRYRGTTRETITDKARRTDRIKVCFTIGENLVIPPGERTMYVRVARPDNVILTLGGGELNTFEYQGERLQFSMRQQVNYQNRPLPVCMNWDKIVEGSAMTGTYNVSIFFEDQEIGKASFTLE
ncbi:MAG: hypothetical protein R6V49_03050 [Bacteroidales bacterium]